MSDEWEGILDADERVIWQGAPVDRLRIGWDKPIEPFFFLFFTGFSIFWMVGASQAGGFFWMFGLLFFGIGIYNLVLIHFWKAYERRNTHYTLTNKRAFIATQGGFKGKRLNSYPISDTTPVSFSDGPLATIHFASRTAYGGRSRSTRTIGFEDITDGRDVYALIRNVQDGTA